MGKLIPVAYGRIATISLSSLRTVLNLQTMITCRFYEQITKAMKKNENVK